MTIIQIFRDNPQISIVGLDVSYSRTFAKRDKPWHNTFKIHKKWKHLNSLWINL